MARGVHGNHATIYPALSPTLWTSIATGKRPPKHGVLGFSEPTGDGRAIRPCSLLSRKTKALWNILAQEGKRSVVVGWWPSYPAEPIPGATVSNHFQQVPDDPEAALPPLLPGMVAPARLLEELSEPRVRPSEIPGEMLRLFVPRFDEVDQAKDKSLHDWPRSWRRRSRSMRLRPTCWSASRGIARRSILTPLTTPATGSCNTIRPGGKGCRSGSSSFTARWWPTSIAITMPCRAGISSWRDRTPMSW